MIVLAEINYSIFPPINATLNSAATILLVLGFLLIRKRQKEAHRAAMLGALACSAVFLVCYLFYHYGAGHTEFPKEYPIARKIYLSILVPHIILAVVNVPLIILLVIAALRGNFERHKKLARFTFPSWLFVSVTGVIIYFMIYVWFPAPDSREEVAKTPSVPLPIAKAVLPVEEETEKAGRPRVTIVEERTTSGDLVFEPAFQAVLADPEEKIVTVTFSVQNEGAKPVGIEELISGCQCLSVEIDSNPINSGEKATITGVFDTDKLRGKSERKITVVVEGQSLPVFLTTRIETKPVYSLEPAMTSWKIGSEVEPKTVEFRVEREEPVHVISAESRRDEVSCELVTVEPGRAYNIVLTPESTEQSLLGIVRIVTDCEIEQYARPLAYFSIQ